MIGEWSEFTKQVAHSLLGLERGVEQLERQVARLDTHSEELAKEVLDLIGRVDGQEGEQRELASRLADVERSDLEALLGDRIARIAERTERSLGALERRVDNHEGDHWRSGW
jgi:predicted RNase H-like nuclease (RuvC/YqgF family)